MNEILNPQKDSGNKDENKSWPQLDSPIKHTKDLSFNRYISKENGKEISVYRSSHHTNMIFDNIKEMQKINMLSDVILVTDDGLEVSAHKMILSASNPYFYAMFGNFAEREMNRVQINGISHDILKLLINFMYFTEIHITECNVQSLLPAANLLQLTIVVNACSDFLLRQLHPSNCFGIREFTKQYDCLELLAQIDSYIEHYFSDIVGYEEFLSLSIENLMKLISNDRLAVSEKTVFDCVISWINHDREKREAYLVRLIEQVRLPLISQEYLFGRVWEENLIKANSQCKDYLIEALKYHFIKGAGKSLFEIPRVIPREPYELPKLLVVVGGSLANAAKSMECFDFRTQTWYPLSDLPTEFIRGIAHLKGKIYALGGCNLKERPLAKMNVYDPVTDQWSVLAAMNVKRIDPGVAALDNMIYAIGGYGQDTTHKSCEAYDIETQKWTMVTPMPDARKHFAVGVLNGSLYVVGGYNTDGFNTDYYYTHGHGRNITVSSRVIYYNSETGSWMTIDNLKTPRQNAGVGVLNGILYVVGGQGQHGEQDILKSVETFDPRTNKWTQVQDMPEGRKDVAVVGLGNNLYVVGGKDNTKYLKSVNVYCSLSNTWTALSSSMSIERGLAGVAIINKPHNYI